MCFVHCYSAQILERSRSLCYRSRNYRAVVHGITCPLQATSAYLQILLHNQGELQGLWRKPQSGIALTQRRKRLKLEYRRFRSEQRGNTCHAPFCSTISL